MIRSRMKNCVDVSAKTWESIICIKNYIWNPSTCTCENGKYSGSIISDSVITCDEITEVAKTVLRKFTPTKALPRKAVPTNLDETFYVLLSILLITISLLIIVSIYFWFLNHWSKQKHFITYPDTSDKLKEIDINNKILKMSNKFKEIIIKNRTYYFSNDMITIKNLDPNKIKIDEKSYKNILIYYIGYVTVNDLSYAKSSSVK